MRFASFDAAGRRSFGAVTGGGIVDLGARMGKIATLRDALAAGVIEAAKERAAGLSPDFALDDVTLLPTVPDAEKYICVGVNYANRNAEYKDRSEQPKYPSLFMRAAESFVGHNNPVVRPPESDQLDYEGEIALVIGKEGRRISMEDAESHIAGLTLLNEGTIRDWLRHGKFNVTQGKNFEKTGSIGPWLVTADEFSGYDDLAIRTTVNGEVRQDDTTASLIFRFDYIIHYLSTFYRLKPGDVIATGTPTGAGARFDPPRWLTPGDRLEISWPAIGVLSNTVIDEAV
jgi:5-carboxymethyl-2-hydroxymuconate isomerase